MHACMYICMNGLYMVHACTYDVSCIVCMNGCMIISITYGEYMPIYRYTITCMISGVCMISLVISGVCILLCSVWCMV